MKCIVQIKAYIHFFGADLLSSRRQNVQNNLKQEDPMAGKEKEISFPFPVLGTLSSCSLLLFIISYLLPFVASLAQDYFETVLTKYVLLFLCVIFVLAACWRVKT